MTEPGTTPDGTPEPDMPDAFYVDLGGGRFASTDATAGPWNPKTQHGGPPSALLGHLFERYGDRDDLRVARVTLDIPRPVPVGELDVEVTALRSGGRTELLEGVVTADGRPVLFGRAWRVARSPRDTPVLAGPPPPAPRPGPQPPHGMSGAHVDGYVSAVEWRFPPGNDFDTAGPGHCWARQRIPLVRGAVDTPLVRVLTLADSSWAVAFELDRFRQFVVNTDVTVALHRDPHGEWLCLDGDTWASPDASGLAHGVLSDEDGACGHVLQTLVISSR